MKRFPNLLFVKWEESGDNDGSFLTAHSTPQEASEQNETVEAALYRLVGKRRIVNSTIVKEKP